MAVRTSINRQAAEEEAEVDVLKSRLESTAQIQRKIEARLAEVTVTGKSLDESAKPLTGAIKSPQKLLESTSCVPQRTRPAWPRPSRAYWSVAHRESTSLTVASVRRYTDRPGRHRENE